MTLRASCRCGQLTATITGESIRVSVCHCLACRRSTGAAFSAQARFAADDIAIEGAWKIWERTNNGVRTASYRWCPECGSTICYSNEGMRDEIAVLLGAIVEGSIPTPGFSIYEDRKLPWVEIVGDDIVHD